MKINVSVVDYLGDNVPARINDHRGVACTENTSLIYNNKGGVIVQN